MNIDKKCNMSFIHLQYTVLNDLIKINKIKKITQSVKKDFLMEERKIIIQINKISNGARTLYQMHLSLNFFPLLVSINKSSIKNVFNITKKKIFS